MIAVTVAIVNEASVHIDLVGTKHTLCGLALVGGEVVVIRAPVDCEKCKEACNTLIGALQACTINELGTVTKAKF